MKAVVRILLVLTINLSVFQGATRSDIAILEASEQIKNVAQEMAKAYAYYYTHPRKTVFYRRAQEKINAIESDMRILARTTKKEKIRQMLDFFAYEKEQLRAVLKERPDREHLLTVLDSSEAFAEGATKIASWVPYDFSPEEQMFATYRHIGYLLKKISKYYIVFGSDIDKISLREKMDEAIQVLESELKKIDQYAYPSVYRIQKDELLKLWSFGKPFYANGREGKLPGVQMIAEEAMESIADELATFHSKNQ